MDIDLTSGVPGLDEQIAVVELFAFGTRSAQIVDTQRNAAIHHQITVKSSGHRCKGTNAHTGHLSYHIIFDLTIPPVGIDADQPLHDEVAAYKRIIAIIMNADIIRT